MVILVILGSAFLIILVALVIVIFVARNISGPIKAVHLVLQKIREGDLTSEVTTVKSKDEIGEMMQLLNYTQESIKDLVSSIKKDAVTLSDIGSNLSSNMTETAAATNEITANVQSIKGRVINQSASVTETHATMEQVEQNINKLNGHVENQSSNISQASSAIEQMLANIQSVTGTLGRNAANVETLQKSSEAGHSGLQEVATDIQEISRESEGLLEINAVMENISSQTNLLSMNAAIEAAHAGEAGKGFAVVADEIRKLAESSSDQSKTISSVLTKIKESISKIIKSTEDVLTKFEAIDSNIKTVAEQEDHILNAMEEQGAGSKQILEGVSNMNEIARQVENASHEMLDGAKEVITESNNLGMVTQEITLSMNEMALGTEQINIAIHQVNDMSIKNRDAITALMQGVSRFKVE
jgi:methyl-accepting chemotaxis protein